MPIPRPDTLQRTTRSFTMLIKRPADIVPSDITPRALFDTRRDFIRAAGLGSRRC
jgi:hypothetical protein